MGNGSAHEPMVQEEYRGSRCVLVRWLMLHLAVNGTRERTLLLRPFGLRAKP